MDRNPTTRRDCLFASGAATLATLAGCVRLSGGEQEDTDDGDSDSGTTEPTTGNENIRETEETGDDSEAESEGAETGDSDGRTIDLGFLMGVSGALTELGPPIRDAAQLVPAQINGADTELEVNTQFEDTGTSPTEGTAGAEALVDAGFPMICGALASAVTREVAESVAVPNGVTMCSPATTSPGLTNLEDEDYVFRTAVSDTQQGAALARIAGRRLGHETASVLALDNAYGVSISTGFVDSFESEFGGTVTAQLNFAAGQSSYTSQLQSVLADEPDTMVLVSYPESGIRILRDFYENFDRNGMDILVADSLQDSSLPDNVGHDLSNVRGTAPDNTGPGLGSFRTAFSEEYGEQPDGVFLREGYDAAASLVLAHAAAEDDNPDGAAVSDNMRAVTSGDGTRVTAENLPEGVEMAANGDAIVYEGASGSVTFDENGDLASPAYEYFGFTSAGDIEVIATVRA